MDNVTLPQPNYLMGHATMETLGKHYTERTKELLMEAGDDPSFEQLSAITYLLGVVDMATAYLVAVETGKVDTQRERIDSAIEAQLNGFR